MPVQLGETNLYAAVGEAGFADLFSRFYAKVRGDDLIGPMYPPNDWTNAERRLRLFVIQRFGGPPTYGAERGPPQLRMRHATFPITKAAAERWLSLMDAAMQESRAAGTIQAAAVDVLWPFFVDAAHFMINRDGDDPE